MTDSPQRQSSRHYLAQLTSPAMDELVELCLSPQRELAPIQHLEIELNTHVFSSPNSDMRFLGAVIKEDLPATDLQLAELGGIPAAAVISFIGSVIRYW